MQMIGAAESIYLIPVELIKWRMTSMGHISIPLKHKAGQKNKWKKKEKEIDVNVSHLCESIVDQDLC